MTEKLQPVRFRLAMRHEGLFWNAYLARSEDMNGAIHLGSIRMTLVESPEMRTVFLDAMTKAMTLAAKQATGLDLVWPDPPTPAPESERSGHA